MYLLYFGDTEDVHISSIEIKNEELITFLKLWYSMFSWKHPEKC